MLEISLEKHIELIKKGYSLDIIYLLGSIDKEVDIPWGEYSILKQTLLRKQLISEEGKITVEGRKLLDYISSPSTVIIVKKRNKNDDFIKWWEIYPSTDTFEYKGRKFRGSRALKAKKKECALKIKEILNEGEYTIDDLVKALEIEIEQKKEISFKTGQNKMSYMQNSYTYLNQRTFEGFIELAKQTEEKPIIDWSGATNI